MELKLNNITVRYGKVQAIRDISLEVKDGQIVAMIGANGAGKTTTLRAISGLNPVASGEIWFGGTRIDGLKPPQIVKMGIAQVQEGRGLFPNMTVMENLVMGAYLRRDKNEIAHDLEEMYEHYPVLKERSRQVAGSLSGGEQQMLAIARALMAKPRLLLMDEPSTGLSPKLVSELGEVINNLNQRGISILLVEQNSVLALSLSHRAYVIETGSITLEGTSKELLSNDQVRAAYLGR